MSQDNYLFFIKHLSVTAYTSFDLIGVEVYGGWDNYFDRPVVSDLSIVPFWKGRTIAGIEARSLLIGNIKDYTPPEKHPLLVSEDGDGTKFTLDCIDLIEREMLPVTIPGLMTVELCSE